MKNKQIKLNSRQRGGMSNANNNAAPATNNSASAANNAAPAANNKAPSAANNKASSVASNSNSNTSDIETNIKSYKTMIIVLIVLLVLFLIGYFLSFSYRESKALYELNIGHSFLFINSVTNTKEHRDKKLCDFYIASAYRPYLVKNQLFDYCSIKVMRHILMCGVRCVYLDVFNSTMNENAYPIVTTGIKHGEWKLGLNSLTFEDVCLNIASLVFSNGYVNNHNDPFILCLNLNTNKNVKCLNKIRKIIYRAFKSRLLSNNYTHQSQNMPSVKIKDLLGKVVIFTSEGYENSELEELVNYSWKKQEINKISYGALDPAVPDTDVVKYSQESLTDFNKSNLTMVVPKEFTWFTSNYDPSYAWNAGCQIVFMNYNKAGKHYDEYLTQFKNDSFLPKPNNMIGKTERQNIPIIANRDDSADSSENNLRLSCPRS